MLQKFDLKVAEIRKDILTMAEFVLASFEQSLEGIKDGDVNSLINAREGNIKHLSYLANSVDNNIIVALALYSPEAGDLRELIALLKSTNELLRIGEASKKYSKGMQDIVESGIDMTALKPYIIELHNITIKTIRLIIECFKNFSMELFRQIHIEEEKSDDVFGILQKEILTSAPLDHEFAARYIKIIKTLKKQERVTDHCENIAKLIHFATEGGRLGNSI